MTDDVTNGAFKNYSLHNKNVGKLTLLGSRQFWGKLFHMAQPASFLMPNLHVNPVWHEFGKQEKCSCLEQPRGNFYKT